METPFKHKVIVFCGLKHAGKNAAATIAVNLLMRNNIDTSIFNFSDRIKEEVSQAYGVSLIELEANKDFWRPVTQFWANDFRIQYQKKIDYWTSLMHLDLETYFYHYPNIKTIALITGARRTSDIEFLKREYNSRFFWVERQTNNKDSHPSENIITRKDCQYFIDNNGSIAQLENELYINLRAAKLL